MQRLVQFTIALPPNKKEVSTAINPDHVVRVQEFDDYGTLVVMDTGPAIEVRASYKLTLEKLNGPKT